MARSQPDEAYSSDTSTDVESVFDDEEAYDTDATEEHITAKNDDDDNPAWLLADNEHPPDYYIQGFEHFDETEYTQEDYSRGTTRLLDRSEQQWNQLVPDQSFQILLTFVRFCAYTRRDPQKDLQNITLNIIHGFFDWLLNQKRGKNGRRMRGTKHKSSLGTYWKVFRLMYERATGDKIGGQVNRSMHKVSIRSSRVQ
jgi:hypothetical protein